MYNVAIITASDKGAAGLRDDISGPTIKDIIEQTGIFQVTEYKIISDEKKELADAMKKLADEGKVNLILTTGGTGFSKRDVTPEATLEVIERRAPGIPEAMRAYSMTITPKAMLSRGEAGIRGNTLIINMPGSPKAVKESLTFIMPALEHGLDILVGATGECAR